MGRRHVVEERRGGRVAGRLGQVRGRDQLAEQHRATGRGHGLVQRLQLLQDVVEVEQALLQDLEILLTVNGQVGQPEDGHQGDEALLGHELPTMVVYRI